MSTETIPTPTAPTTAPPVQPNDDGELPRATVIATLAGIIAAMLLGALDSTIVGTAMPRVIAELHGFEHYAAVSTIYMLASTVIVPIAGKLSDLYGRKPFLLLGVGIFVLGSVACGMATSMTQLVIFRGVQGLGGGFSQAMAFTTIADLFPPARRGKVSGIMGSVFGLSSVVGPWIGGLLTDGPGWRWCFYVNIPIGIAAFLVLLFAFPTIRRSENKNPKIDYLGALALVLGVTPILLGLSWAGRDYAWDSWQIIALLGGGGVVTALFFVIETKAPEAILPPKLFANRIVWTTSAAATMVSMGMFGTAMFIPLFLQSVAGVSATKSGTAMTPMMMAMIVSSIISGQLMSRLGRYKVIAIVGVSVTTIGMFLLSLMDVNTGYAAVLTNMIIVGIGLGSTMPVFNLAVQNAVDIRQVGVATSALQFVRSLGGSLGMAIFGAVLSNRYGPALTESVSPDVVAALPPGLMDKLANPQMMMNPEFQKQIADGGPLLMQKIAPVLGGVKQALASSLHDVFLIGTIVVAVGVAFALLIKDAPLRKTNRVGPPTPE